MIISIDKKFIFIANLKTASTSIEAALRPHGDIVVRRSELGKHLPYTEIQHRFRWVFNTIKEEEFFKFGVIRDPLDYAISLYRSHNDEKFKSNNKLYTGDINFDEFLETWVPNNPGQLQPQISKFIDNDGKLALDHLILYSKLENEFPVAMRKIGIPEIKLPRMNVSPSVDVEISEEAEMKVKDIMSKDYDEIAKIGY
ncbi:hypothetical protein GU3_14750 [Oceanimonas sp. GK1]|uniref:sulfotransferase family 2 domain-containing protein n=1 Tax=Oceanimonas sp. (strain GK1 / IBRC-M 10197) TaxID=511062 RepID=UPI0002495121|nr:sulfotransferase family 2 domain-containing protein [Oceanimonas sp. GK1]AEY02703.1 hypothetical protein GU3_14750 [Oceanimonas sp. GK1]